MEDETDEGGATTAQDAVAMAAALPSTSTSASVRFPQGFREPSPTLNKIDVGFRRHDPNDGPGKGSGRGREGGIKGKQEPKYFRADS